MAQLVKNSPTMQEPWVRSLGWEDSLGERKDYPLQYSLLKNSIDTTEQPLLSLIYIYIYGLGRNMQIIKQVE